MATSDIAGNSSEDLNEAQLRAVTHESGPARVIAGAGTGKTRVLTRRIAHLIGDKGVDPGSILAITFTNKAAEEMRARVGALVGQLVRGMWISTFHRACVRILRRDAERIGYPRNFTIYDQADSHRLTKLVLTNLGLDVKQLVPRYVHQDISMFKNQLQTPELVTEHAGGPNEIRLARIYDEYQQRLHKAEAMDFGDLLMQTVLLLRSNPDVLGRYQEQFAHILVDEYQDTNPAQNELVLLLGRAHKNVFVVGDSDQSIYAFRGADSRNIKQFKRGFGNCTTYKLEQNYRSTQVILDAANALIANNRNREPKHLWTDDVGGLPVECFRGSDDSEEARFVVDQVQQCNGGNLSSGANSTGCDSVGDPITLADIAILYRTKAQSSMIEKALVKEAIAYKVVGGTRFYDRAEVRDAMAFLRCAVNPADEVSLKRILNVPARGVGATSVARLDAFAQANGVTFSAALRSAAAAGVIGKAVKGVAGFAHLHDELCDRVPAGPRAVLEHAVTASGYVESLRAEDSVGPDGRLENLVELLTSASEYETCERFLEQVALVNDTDDLPDGEMVSLMTLHAAKGLEYPVVFFTGLEDGICPHYMSVGSPEAMEEERRVAFVGFTRAKQRLYLTSAAERTRHRKVRREPQSQFIEEALQNVVGLAA